MSEQIRRIAADLKAGRLEDEKVLKRCKPVADRVRFFSDLQSSSGSDRVSVATSYGDIPRGTFPYAFRFPRC